MQRFPGDDYVRGSLTMLEQLQKADIDIFLPRRARSLTLIDVVGYGRLTLAVRYRRFGQRL
jgi:hypothetical protein